MTEQEKSLSAEEIRKLEEKTAEKAAGDDWRLRFHLMPPTGWLMDTNGLRGGEGANILFFPDTPDDIKPGKKNYWGHYRTRDFVNYEYLPPALASDQAFDSSGVYSGARYRLLPDSKPTIRATSSIRETTTIPIPDASIIRSSQKTLTERILRQNAS